MAERRTFSGAAQPNTILNLINNLATTITLADATIAAGWPAGPAFATIRRGTASQEDIKYASRSGAVLNSVTRQLNDTTAVEHPAGSTIEHTITKTDVDEANAHVSDSEADPHATKLLNNARHDLSTRHPLGTVIPVGSTVTDSLPGNAGNAGTAASLSRSDHIHTREPYGAVGNVTASAPGDTAAAGTVDAIARVDHKHAREAPGSGGTPLTYGTPGASAVGDAITAGTAASVARSDHKHGREAFGNVAGQTTFSLVADNGAATTVARSDHRHGTPALAHTVLSSSTTATTTSTSYGALTGSLAVTVTVSITGRLSIEFAAGQSNSGAFITSTHFALSGANTRSGLDAEAIQVGGTNYIQTGRTIHLSGLAAGSTTVTLVHRVTGGTGSISNRYLAVAAL